MNISKRASVLKQKILSCLKENADPSDLSSYTLDIISYFLKTPESQLPRPRPFEKVFWYAVLRTQKLCALRNLDPVLFKSSLEEVLLYLNGDKLLPKESFGKRPTLE